MSIESIGGNASPITKEVASFPASSASRRSPPAEENGRSNAASESGSTKPNEPSKAEVEKAAQRLTDFVAKNNRPELNFSVDESSGVRIIQVVDTASREVIRQIPSEEAVQLAQALDKLQGLFVKDKA